MEMIFRVECYQLLLKLDELFSTLAGLLGKPMAHIACLPGRRVIFRNGKIYVASFLVSARLLKEFASAFDLFYTAFEKNGALKWMSIELSVVGLRG